MRPLTDDPLNRYAGRLFERPNQTGHMLVQHYLDKMFRSGQDFLDKPLVTQQFRSPDKLVDLNGQGVGATQKVRELSRLAAYLGGKSPT